MLPGGFNQSVFFSGGFNTCFDQIHQELELVPVLIGLLKVNLLNLLKKLRSLDE